MPDTLRFVPLEQAEAEDAAPALRFVPKAEADKLPDTAPAAQRPLPDGVRPSSGRSAEDPRRLDNPEPFALGDPMGSGAEQMMAQPTQPTRESVLQDTVLPEPTLSGAQLDENLRLSRRDYAQGEPLGTDPRAVAPKARPALPTESRRWADRGALLADAPMPVRAAAQAAAGAAEGAHGAVRAGLELADQANKPDPLLGGLAPSEVNPVTMLTRSLLHVITGGKGPSLQQLARMEGGAAKDAKDFQTGMGDPRGFNDFGPDSPVPYLAKQAEGAASSLGQSIATATVLGPRAVIPFLSIQSAGQQYQQARAAGLSPNEAIANAVPYGIFEAVGEKYQGLDKAAVALRTLMTKGASAQAVKDAGEILIHAGVREIPGEVITYLGQTGVDLLPGIGLNQNLTVPQFLDGLRDTVVQAGMMGVATGGGGALAVARGGSGLKAEKSAEQLAREKGFLVKEETAKRMKEAGEKEIAGQLTREVDSGRAEDELTVLQGKPWAQDPEFQTRYRQLRADGVKPAEAAGRAAMSATFGAISDGAGIAPEAWQRAVDAAAKLPMEKVPAFFEAFAGSLAKKMGAELPVPPGTITTETGGARDDAIATTMKDVYGEEPPTETVKGIQDLEAAAQSGGVPGESGGVTPPVATTETPGAAPDGDKPLKLLSPNEAGAQMGHSNPDGSRPATKEQILAGNAPLGHMTVGGMGFSIENQVGSVRTDLHNEPPKFSTPMEHGFHYGYGKRTLGADGDHVDAFIQQDIPEDYNGPVHVIDQVNKDGTFDEHKAIIAPIDEAQARQAYLAHYEKGWRGLGAIRTFPTFTEFKKWVTDGKKSEPASPDAFTDDNRLKPVFGRGHPDALAQADSGATPVGSPARPDGGAGAAAAPANGGPIAVAPGEPTPPEAAKARWLRALASQNAIQKDTDAKITDVVNGRASFAGDPSATKQGRGLLATYNEAVKAGATPDEIKHALFGTAAPTTAVGHPLTVTFAGKTYPVQSLEDAAEKWAEFRDRATKEGAGGVSDLGNGVDVMQGDTVVARVSYNGRIHKVDGASPDVDGQKPAPVSDNADSGAPVSDNGHEALQRRVIELRKQVKVLEKLRECVAGG
jgi:hypothetical protein